MSLLAQVPTNGLVGYWPFHGNANDSSGSGNHGSVNGAVLSKDRFGNCNQAYKFDGINDLITVQNSSSVQMSNTDFTLAVWIKTYMNDTNSMIIGKNLYGSWSGYILFSNFNNSGYCTAYKHVSFYAAAGASQDACSDNAVNADTLWKFLTGVYDHVSNKGYLYVNGVQQMDIGQASGVIANTVNLTFGGNYVPGYYYSGVLDNIRIYNRILSQSEILQLYNEPNPGSGLSAGNALHDTAICSGSVTITLNAAVGNNYNWSNGSTSQSIVVNSPGTYWVQFQGTDGCQYNDTAVVASVIPDSSSHLAEICSSEYYTLPGGSEVNAAGIYKDTLSNSFGCDSIITVTLSVNPPPQLTVTSSGNTVSVGNAVILTATGASAYSWNNGSTTASINVGTSDPGTFSYCVTGTNPNGCTDSLCTMVYVSDVICPEIFVPDAFSPNGDLSNDKLQIFGTDCIRDFSFRLFDRWGEKIFETQDPQFQWNGTFAGQILNVATFAYILDVTLHSGKQFQQKGNVKLVR
jgi:gliding motility-associated-like protein